MTRSFSLAALTSLLLLSACGEKPQQALAPHPQPSMSVPVPECTLWPDQVKDEINTLFLIEEARTAAIAEFDAVIAALAPIPPGPDAAAARVHAMQLVGMVIQAYRADALVGGRTPETRVAAAKLINVVLCYVGLPMSFPADALTEDGTAGVVTPDATTTIVNDDAVVGIQVPSGSVTVPVLVTITRLPDTPGPLHTQLDQYPIYYEFHVTPEVELSEEAVVGVCLAEGYSPAPPDTSRLRVAHNVGDGIEILPLVPAPFLNCDNLTFGAAPTGHPLLDFARAGWRRVGPVLASLLGPSTLSAAPLFASGVGGTTRNFSPFGLVDPLVEMTPSSPLRQGALPGSPVSPPSVTLQTPNGHHYSGLAVDFAVTPVGGSVGTLSATTNEVGVASAGTWTLGPLVGPNTVSATARPPHLPSGVLNSPMVFSAAGLGDPEPLAVCGPGEGAGDEVTRAFYHPQYPGWTLNEVTLFLSSNARANRSATYRVQLVARRDNFTGDPIFSDEVDVPLRGTPSENRAVVFRFADVAVTQNSVLTFEIDVTKNPTGAKLFFNLGRGGDVGPDNGRRGERCPLVETLDASGTLSTFRHQGVAIQILGRR